MTSSPHSDDLKFQDRKPEDESGFQESNVNAIIKKFKMDVETQRVLGDDVKSKSL